VIYGRPFFDLQFAFAEKVSTLSGLPLARALLDYTNFYVQFGLARDFDVEHPVWQAYLAGLKDADDGRAWTYRFYLTRPHDVEPPGVATVFGCFSYARLDAGRIRLHFRNVETDGQSPLAGERRGERMAELRALFAHMRGTVGGPVRVIGESWLYNLEAYRRVFPASYLASARVASPRFRHMPLWGQFVDRHGALRRDLADHFLERLRRLPSLERLGECFPFQALALQAPVTDFYEFHGLEVP
jgi:hypothetical protein